MQLAFNSLQSLNSIEHALLEGLSLHLHLLVLVQLGHKVAVVEVLFDQTGSLFVHLVKADRQRFDLRFQFG